MSDKEDGDDGDLDDIEDDVPEGGLGQDVDEGSPIVTTTRVHARDNPLQAMLAGKKAREEERLKKLERAKGACGRVRARGAADGAAGRGRGSANIWRAEKLEKLKKLGIKDEAAEREVQALSNRRQSVRVLQTATEGEGAMDARMKRMVASAWAEGCGRVWRGREGRSGDARLAQAGSRSGEAAAGAEDAERRVAGADEGEGGVQRAGAEVGTRRTRRTKARRKRRTPRCASGRPRPRPRGGLRRKKSARKRSGCRRRLTRPGTTRPCATTKGLLCRPLRSGCCGKSRWRR
jgi:hypothetical protein